MNKKFDNGAENYIEDFVKAVKYRVGLLPCFFEIDVLCRATIMNSICRQCVEIHNEVPDLWDSIGGSQ